MKWQHLNIMRVMSMMVFFSLFGSNILKKFENY